MTQAANDNGATLVESLARQVEALTRAVERLAGTMPLVDILVAADYLGVCPKTVRRMVASGELPHRRVGRQLRFNLVQLAPIRTGRD